MSPLHPLPPTFPATVATLHRVAEQQVSPAQPNGEIALMATPRGFGTPVFDRDRQVRVDGTELVRRAGDEERREPLDVDPDAAARLADWYAFGHAVLEAFVAGAAAEDAPTPIRLWPEHFDIAIELGPEQAGRRANYGFSPGDEQHAEPYAYVGPWTAEVQGELWQASAFNGAELSYSELLAAPDQRAAALAFLTTRHAALTETARSDA
ncbi:MAG: hypothetical protein ACXW08_18035 [Solirubrobacteraceae bacterium]